MDKKIGTAVASQHPDYFVRKAEDLGAILGQMVKDLSDKTITVEMMGWSYQTVCVEYLREAYEKGLKERITR